MAKQSLIWTCLPNGATADRRGLRVSVLVSPRLDAEADAPELSSFPDWVDWPATVGEAVFTFFADGQPVARSAVPDQAGVTRHDATLGAPDSAVWRALFREDLRVRGYRPADRDALLNSDVLSYSTTDVHDLVKDLYVDLAARSGSDLPRIHGDLLNHPSWQELVSVVGQIDRWGHDREAGNLPIGEGPTPIERRFAALRGLAATRAGTARNNFSEKALHLARFELFHTPPLRPKPVKKVARADDPRIEVASQAFERPDVPTERELADSLDYHRIVAAMNAYPTLLRRLGLVVDFILDRGAVPSNADSTLRVEVECPALRTRRDAADLTPVTHVHHDDAGFVALSRVFPGPGDETRVEGGLLDLYTQPDRYSVLQADVDGAGLKLMNFARTLGHYQQNAALDPALYQDDVSRHEKRTGAPALRTAGMMLVRKDRALALEARMAANRKQAQQAAAPSPATELWAEDLVRGYRIDVWDAQTGVWRSLCRRLAEYRLADGQLLVTPEEGEEEATVQLAATRSPDRTYNAGILYLHEAMVSWTGWSLGAPPPGKGIGDDLRPGPDGKPPLTDGAEPVSGLNLESSFRAVPGSLPRLRYGRSYALRARAVDLAGNSLPPSEEDVGPEHPALVAQLFLRFEPVAAPVLALVRPDGGATERPQEGESMHRLAIRTFNDVFDDPTPSPQVARREAVPPQSTVREAELHGQLDQAGVLNPGTFPMLAHDKDRDARDPDAALVEETIPLRGPLDAAAVDTTFAVWREGMSLTYLPDPLVESVSAWFIDHPAIAAHETLHMPLYPAAQRWPDAQPIRIELYEDPLDPAARPAFDEAARVLRVPLPKGERATLRLSMRIPERDLFERMGMWRWLNEATQQKIAHAALEGRCWLFTPWQDVQLVHAVQRPLLTPDIQRLVIERSLGETSALPRFVVRCSIKTTDRLDLLASWHEPEHLAGSAEPKDISRGDLAFQVKVTGERDYVRGPDAYPDHSLPADENEAADVIGINRRQDWVARKLHEFNDTRYRRIEYRLKATTRFREFLTPELLLEPDPAVAPGPYNEVEDALVVEGPGTVTWIPSSAPPPPPQVQYVVPTFGWVRSRDESGTARSWRRGGGLRVYLTGPWNVSGYGEMLAVVLPPADFRDNPDNKPSGHPYKKFVTQWGNDPIWESPFVAGLAPRRLSFPLARWRADPDGGWLLPWVPRSEADQPPGDFRVTALAPPKALGAAVEVAPHDVFYDAARQLWYCDIEIDQGQSYWPFIRLALARYQPCSSEGAHLSDVVLADFMPLAADRSLTVRPEREGRIRNVTVHGPQYTNSAGAREVRPRSEFNPLTGQVTVVPPVAPTSVVEVWLERLDPALGDDFGWRKIASGAPRSTAPDAQRPVFLSALTPEQSVHANHLLATRNFRAALAEGFAERLVLRPPLWDGRVEVPEGEAAQGRLRLVVAEYEEYPMDGGPEGDSMSTTRTGRRLVFVEHIPLES